MEGSESSRKGFQGYVLTMMQMWFARDLRRCWAKREEMLRAMHWWAKLWGLKGVTKGVLGGGVYSLVA
jgi:hypothetical protein